jgi:sulfatase modifying factor 1
MKISRSNYFKSVFQNCILVFALFSISIIEFGCNNPIAPTLDNVNGVVFKMIPVSGGTFTMGCTPEQEGDCSNDEYPAHPVTVSDFMIGESEVTQQLWFEVMGTNPSHYSGCVECPVESVDWFEVQIFIQELNQLTGKQYRLPTEAEWEFAARGGNLSEGYKYSGRNTLDYVAWYQGNSGMQTHPVKGKFPNELGIYDMSGNVSEWVSDWYAPYSAAAQNNPTGPLTGTGKIARGGRYYGDISYCRVTHRYTEGPAYNSSRFGFRLALD